MSWPWGRLLRALLNVIVLLLIVTSVMIYHRGRRSSQSVNRIESTALHDSKSVHSDLGIVRDASLSSLNSSVIQLKQDEGVL